MVLVFGVWWFLYICDFSFRNNIMCYTELYILNIYICLTTINIIFLYYTKGWKPAMMEFVRVLFPFRFFLFLFSEQPKKFLAIDQVVILPKISNLYCYVYWAYICMYDIHKYIRIRISYLYMQTYRFFGSV